MPSEKRIAALVDGQGFTRIEDPGFVGFIRRHPTDNRRQWVRFFTWGNPKHADDADGNPRVPRTYLVIIPGLDYDIDGGDGERYRLPLVAWPDDPAQRVPASQQELRPWKDVVAEFHEVFMAAMNAPYIPGLQALEGLEERYRL